MSQPLQAAGDVRNLIAIVAELTLPLLEQLYLDVRG